MLAMNKSNNLAKFEYLTRQIIKGERMKSHAKKLAVAVAACSLSLSGLTQAQKLEEVVVTAAKVEASIQDTPIAVSAFSQEQLDASLLMMRLQCSSRFLT